jgi:hypothetical protein
MKITNKYISDFSLIKIYAIIMNCDNCESINPTIISCHQCFRSFCSECARTYISINNDDIHYVICSQCDNFDPELIFTDKEESCCISLFECCRK